MGATAQPQAAPRAARHPGRLAALLSWIAVPLFAAALLWPALASERILAPLDALGAFEPWSSAEPGPPANEALLDQAIVTIPWLHRAAVELRAGRLPLWNPDNYLGQPLHASASGALAYPLSFLYYLFPGLGTLEWMAFARVVLAGLFLRAFLRARGLPPLASALGGMTFAGSGFFVAWLGHPHTNVALLLPAALWCVERAARRPDARAVGATALVVGGMALGGHFQTALHAGLAVAAYAVYRWFTGAERLGAAGTGRLALGVLLGACVGAVQLLPTAEYLGDSQAAELFNRLDPTAEVGFAEAAVLLVDPNAHGRPDRGGYTGPRGDNLNFNELIGGYVGRIALVLALLGLLTRGPRGKLFFAGLGVFAAAVAWQLPPFYELVRELGPLRRTKLLRLLMLVALALAVLAAHGAATLERILGGRRGVALGSLVLLGVAVELLAFGRGYQPAIEPRLALPATPLTDHLSSVSPPPRVLCVDNSTLLPSANLFYDIPLITGYDSIEERRTVELLGRLTSDPRAAWFLKEIRYFDRQLPLGSMLGIDRIVSDNPLPAPLELEHASPDGPSVYRNPNAMPRVFLARSVERIDEGSERLDRLASPTYSPWHAIVEEAPPAGFETYVDGGDRGSVSEIELGPQSLEAVIQADSPALVVIAEAFAPGWSARLDGEGIPISRTNHALRGVWVPAGRHELELVYAPGSVRLGIAITLVALGISGVLLLRRSPR